MKSKYKLYDTVKDIVSGFTGQIISIHLGSAGFSYSVATKVDEKQTFITTDFNESRLEADYTLKNRIGFHLETD